MLQDHVPDKFVEYETDSAEIPCQAHVSRITGMSGYDILHF